MDGPPFLPKNFLLSPSAQPPTHTPAKPRRKYLFAHSLVKRWDPLPIQDLRLKKYFRTNCLLLLFRSTLFYNCWDWRENILLILSFLSSRYVLALMSPPHGQGRARPLGKGGGGEMDSGATGEERKLPLSVSSCSTHVKRVMLEASRNV